MCAFIVGDDSESSCAESFDDAFAAPTIVGDAMKVDEGAANHGRRVTSPTFQFQPVAVKRLAFTGRRDGSHVHATRRMQQGVCTVGRKLTPHKRQRTYKADFILNASAPGSFTSVPRDRSWIE